jgi:hypothetical protein
LATHLFHSLMNDGLLAILYAPTVRSIYLLSDIEGSG